MLDAPHTPALAVLRFAKLRTMGKLAVASQHNTRTADSGLSHTTPPPDGPGVVLLDGQADAADAWHERAAAVGLGKPRRDAVLAVEMVMSASPSWFAAATPDERADWTRRSMEYARATFGPANILQAVRHDDEETPHIHVLAIPLEQKERARAGRPRKGREGAKRAPVLSWGLNADRILGGPEKLREHQSAYAAEMADLGIRRGRPKRDTKAQHKPAAIYRAEAAQDRAEASKVLAAALTIQADDGITIRANRQLVGQAVANLADNAIKYSARAAQRPVPGVVEVKAGRSGGLAEICVADRGPGIEAKDRDRALRRFVRLEKSRTQPGTGLGLSLVAAVARLHNGAVRLEDNDPGLRVVVTLPVVPQDTGKLIKSEQGAV